ncbi:hypothetical protein [Cellulomonas endophytica]|uniref:hypothetical protein n=1 Tax=Cellulomonas endophytica TaxID=2494735 RepID=UPI0010118D42|nr:hypothetical protein [Cellulomonas endophytica]
MRARGTTTGRGGARHARGGAAGAALLATGLVLALTGCTGGGPAAAGSTPPSAGPTEAAPTSAAPSPTASGPAEPAASATPDAPGTAEPAPSATADPPPVGADGRRAATPSITYAAALGDGTAEVDAVVAEVVETGGTCTVTLRAGAEVRQASVAAFADATTTVCEPALLDVEGLTGAAVVDVEYSSPTSTGTSAPTSLELG